ncbi:MAG: hypothetical protein BIFFINMI_01396 [Phycisphaerae bacterium]|nr:hypothetical protein [Phycisphaerae bacterium]
MKLLSVLPAVCVLLLLASGCSRQSEVTTIPEVTPLQVAQSRADHLQLEVDKLNKEVGRLNDQLQGSETPVNLGRTSLAAVSASSVAGCKALDDPLCGVRNAFDAGSNWVDGVNATDWKSCGENDPWLQIDFDSHVSLTSIAAQGGKIDRAEIWQVKSGMRSWAATDGRVRFEQPQHGVTRVRVHLQTGESAGLAELMVMGYVPVGVDYAQTTPRIAWDGSSVRVAALESYRQWGHGPTRAAASRVAESAGAWQVTVVYDGVDMCRVKFDKATGAKEFTPLAIMKPVATVEVPEGE